MNFVTLTLGLILERFTSHWLHMREIRWLDGYSDWVIKRLNDKSGLLGFFLALLFVLLPVLPVIFVLYFIGDVWGVWAFWVFSVLILVLSLGPRDLRQTVEELADANDRGDLETARRVSKEITELDPPETPLLRCRAIAEAIFVQANNRMFGVVFWFLVAGAAGGWAFRMSDMIRRRVMYEGTRQEDVVALENCVKSVFRVHGILAWIPARLLALGYAMAGSFEEAVSDWRRYYQNTAEHFFEISEDVMAASGCGALGRAMQSEGKNPQEICDIEAGTVRSAMRLVNRTLLVWMTVAAVLTIVGLKG